jgi:hypothetical protein
MIVFEEVGITQLDVSMVEYGIERGSGDLMWVALTVKANLPVCLGVLRELNLSYLVYSAT